MTFLPGVYEEFQPFNSGAPRRSEFQSLLAELGKSYLSGTKNPLDVSSNERILSGISFLVDKQLVFHAARINP